jgi:hypothetical protein
MSQPVVGILVYTPNMALLIYAYFVNKTEINVKKLQNSVLDCTEIADWRGN